jgi:transcriptional regulator with XRE-family HTH domain
LHQGRLTWLKQQLAERALKVSVESIRKWLEGEGRPKQEKCEKLAQVLGVDATWLYMGSGVASDKVGNAEANFARAPVLPIAIRDNLVVEISGLPLDLSKAEATKLANVLLAHAVA